VAWSAKPIRKKRQVQMKAYLVGIDLAKNVFQLQAVDKKGNVLKKLRLRRDELLPRVKKLSPQIVAMEACGGAHFWARQFEKAGCKTRLIPPQFVVPFRRSNKDDDADAEAICIAATRPGMHFVSLKGVWHHDVQSLHRLRQHFISKRVALSNMIRGLLSEYGVIAPKGVAKFKAKLKDLISAQSLEKDLSAAFKEELIILNSEFEHVESIIRRYTDKIEFLAANNKTCKQLTRLTGVGPLIATATLATFVNPGDYKNGRQASAWVGVVPRHKKSAESAVMLGISKGGDKYYRTLLIHGARASLLSAHRRKDPVSRWAVQLKEKKGLNKAAVALANKNVRLIWAMLKKGDSFKMVA
jgi:transposase